MRKKGFTLIELLAVILILGIIVLISTPVVTKIIKNARKNAYKSSTMSISEAASLYYSSASITNDGTFNGYECTFLEGSGCDEISFKGNRPNSGNITIDQLGNISGAVVYGEYTYYICEGIVSEEDTECAVSPQLTSVYESYSLDEVDTGKKWIDGNTIYRKVITFGSGTTGVNAKVNFDIVVSSQMIVRSSSEHTYRTVPWLYYNASNNLDMGWVGGYYIYPSGYINFQLGSNIADFEYGHIIIEYTKKTS